MNLEQLYQEYGKLLIQAEVLQGKIQEVKSKIANELNCSRPQTQNTNVGAMCQK